MNTIETIIDIHYKKLMKSERKGSMNVMLEGDPSSGKSFIVERFAKEYLKVPFVSLSAPTLIVETLTGIVFRDGDSVKYSTPYWMDILKDGGVLLIDEFNAAEDDIQKVLLSLLSERRINSHVLHDDVLIIAAQNNYRQVNNYKVSPAILSRFSKYTVSFDYDDWRNNYLPNVLHPVALSLLDELVSKGFSFSKGQDFVQKEITTTARSVERWLTGVEDIDKDRLMFTALSDIDDSNIVILKSYFNNIENAKDKANSFFGGDKNINASLNKKLSNAKKVSFDNIKKFSI